MLFRSKSAEFGYIRSAQCRHPNDAQQATDNPLYTLYTDESHAGGRACLTFNITDRPHRLIHLLRRPQRPFRPMRHFQPGPLNEGLQAAHLCCARPLKATTLNYLVTAASLIAATVSRQSLNLSENFPKIRFNRAPNLTRIRRKDDEIKRQIKLKLSPESKAFRMHQNQ